MRLEKRHARAMQKEQEYIKVKLVEGHRIDMASFVMAEDDDGVSKQTSNIWVTCP